MLQGAPNRGRTIGHAQAFPVSAPQNRTMTCTNLQDGEASYRHKHLERKARSQGFISNDKMSSSSDAREDDSPCSITGLAGTDPFDRGARTGAVLKRRDAMAC